MCFEFKKDHFLLPGGGGEHHWIPVGTKWVDVVRTTQFGVAPISARKFKAYQLDSYVRLDEISKLDWQSF